MGRPKYGEATVPDSNGVAAATPLPVTEAAGAFLAKGSKRPADGLFLICPNSLYPIFFYYDALFRWNPGQQPEMWWNAVSGVCARPLPKYHSNPIDWYWAQSVSGVLQRGSWTLMGYRGRNKQLTGRGCKSLFPHWNLSFLFKSLFQISFFVTLWGK